ncbi:hypothetical protein Trydic_g5390 [Trypoxylus dichotomus]
MDLEKFKELQRDLIRKDKERLRIPNKVNKHIEDEEGKVQQNINENEIQPSDCSLEKEDNLKSEQPSTFSNNLNQNVSVVERLNFSCNEGSLETRKQSFINKLVNSENPLIFRSDGSNCTMLRYGEYSPNNPHLRVSTAPYLGLGEYEQRRQLLLKQRQEDYKEHINQKNERIKNTVRKILESKPVPTAYSKTVQTDIQNINNRLVQYDNQENNCLSKDSSPESANSNKENRKTHSNGNSSVQRIDQRLTTVQNSLLPDMDKPRSILSNRRTETRKDHFLSDYNQGYVPSCLDGFSYHDKFDEIQKERLKRETYQQELRNQIEEKRRLTELRQEQERREQERENRRLEQQLLRMQEEQLREEQIKAIREDKARRSNEEFLRKKQDLQLRSNYRKRLESESSTLSLRNTNVASKLSHYSPPVSRRNTLSYTVPSSSSSYTDTSPRLETLSINDSLSRMQRRHSATQQDLSMIRRSPNMQRRSSSSRLDDSPLPIPILKAHSPVAQELKNSVAINSSRPDIVKRIEDKWQVYIFPSNFIYKLG